MSMDILEEESQSPCEARTAALHGYRVELAPLLAPLACALARPAGLSARACSPVGVVEDLLWAPGISGVPSAEGRSLNPGRAECIRWCEGASTFLIKDASLLSTLRTQS